MEKIGKEAARREDREVRKQYADGTVCRGTRHEGRDNDTRSRVGTFERNEDGDGWYGKGAFFCLKKFHPPSLR